MTSSVRIRLLGQPDREHGAALMGALDASIHGPGSRGHGLGQSLHYGLPIPMQGLLQPVAEVLGDRVPTSTTAGWSALSM